MLARLGRALRIKYMFSTITSLVLSEVCKGTELGLIMGVSLFLLSELGARYPRFSRTIVFMRIPTRACTLSVACVDA